MTGRLESADNRWPKGYLEARPWWASLPSLRQRSFVAAADTVSSDVALESENGGRVIELFAGIFGNAPVGIAARRNDQHKLPLCTIIQ